MSFWKSLFGKSKTKPMKPKLKCRDCGHVQRKGDWEDAMDRQAKAMGSGGFVNINAKPQCLRCGKTQLEPA